MATNAARRQDENLIAPKSREDVLGAVEEIERHRKTLDWMRERMNEKIAGVRQAFSQGAIEDVAAIRKLSKGIRPLLEQFLKSELPGVAKFSGKLSAGKLETIRNYLSYLDRAEAFSFSEGARQPGIFNIEKFTEALPEPSVFVIMPPFPMTPAKGESLSRAAVAKFAENLRSADDIGKRMTQEEAVSRAMGDALNFSDANSIALAANALQDLETKAGRSITAAEAVTRILAVKAK